MKIIGIASAVPERVDTNESMETRLGLEKGWIERRTGIRRRPIAGPEEATSDLAYRAGNAALQQSSIDRRDVGLLLLATSTPDHLLPPTAPLVAYRLGLQNAGAVDLAGACAGFIYAMVMAGNWGQARQKHVLVIGANILSRRVNPDDAATASLFGDGAGAAVMAPAEPSHILGSYLGSDGSLYDALGIPAGGTREPLTADKLRAGENLMRMRRGSTVFKQAVKGMAHAARESMLAAGTTPDAMDWWVPHQANMRMIRDAGTLIGIPAERTISVVEMFANSSAATIPIALAHAAETGRIQRGHSLLLTAAGAGLVSAGMVLRW